MHPAIVLGLGAGSFTLLFAIALNTSDWAWLQKGGGVLALSGFIVVSREILATARGGTRRTLTFSAGEGMIRGHPFTGTPIFSPDGMDWSPTGDSPQEVEEAEERRKQHQALWDEAGDDEYEIEETPSLIPPKPEEYPMLRVAVWFGIVGAILNIFGDLFGRL